LPKQGYEGVSTPPEWPAGPTKVHGPRKAKVRNMVLVTVFVFVALFSIISIVLSAEEPSRTNASKQDPLFWANLGRH
jgi:hypothetical protein